MSIIKEKKTIWRKIRIIGAVVFENFAERKKNDENFDCLGQFE